MEEVSTDQLKRIVEFHHGGTATLTQSVPVSETFSGKAVWQVVVHVYELVGHPKAYCAYAWSREREDGKRRFYAVLHLGQVTGPVEAVRAAFVAERRERFLTGVVRSFAWSRATKGRFILIWTAVMAGGTIGAITLSNPHELDAVIIAFLLAASVLWATFVWYGLQLMLNLSRRIKPQKRNWDTTPERQD